MKKIIALTLLVIMFCFYSIGFSATKYDSFVNHKAFVKMTTGFEDSMSKNQFLDDYISVVLSEKDMDNIIKNGTILDKEKRKFLAENKYKMMRFFQHIIISKDISNLDVVPKEHEFIYITGVIKAHASGKSIAKARTPEEAQMEKMLFQEHVLYRIWEYYQKPGNLEKLCNQLLTAYDKDIQNQKGKKR